MIKVLTRFMKFKYILAFLPIVFFLLILYLTAFYFFPKTLITTVIVVIVVKFMGENKLKTAVDKIFSCCMKPIAIYYMWCINKKYISEGEL